VKPESIDQMSLTDLLVARSTVGKHNSEDIDEELRRRAPTREEMEQARVESLYILNLRDKRMKEPLTIFPPPMLPLCLRL
jgi:hypothetical protein